MRRSHLRARCLLAVLLAAAAIATCTPVGQPFAALRRNELRLGVTTMADAVGLLGPPYRRDAEQLVYEYVRWAAGGPAADLLDLYFREGVLHGWIYSDGHPADFVPAFARLRVGEDRDRALAAMPEPTGVFQCPAAILRCAGGDELRIWAKQAASSPSLLLDLVVVDASGHSVRALESLVWPEPKGPPTIVSVARPAVDTLRITAQTRTWSCRYSAERARLLAAEEAGRRELSPFVCANEERAGPADLAPREVVLGAVGVVQLDCQAPETSVVVRLDRLPNNDSASEARPSEPTSAAGGFTPPRSTSEARPSEPTSAAGGFTPPRSTSEARCRRLAVAIDHALRGEPSQAPPALSGETVLDAAAWATATLLQLLAPRGVPRR